MNQQQWYLELIKPEWAPPGFLFGPVWTVLYIMILISFGYVLYNAAVTKEISWMIALPFILNLLFNISFTYIQMKLGYQGLATIWILLTVGTLIWGMAAIWSEHRWVAYMQIPYLAWISFATFLQGTVWWLNR